MFLFKLLPGVVDNRVIQFFLLHEDLSIRYSMPVIYSWRPVNPIHHASHLLMTTCQSDTACRSFTHDDLSIRYSIASHLLMTTCQSDTVCQSSTHDDLSIRYSMPVIYSCRPSASWCFAHLTQSFQPCHATIHTSAIRGSCTDARLEVWSQNERCCGQCVYNKDCTDIYQFYWNEIQLYIFLCLESINEWMKNPWKEKSIAHDNKRVRYFICACVS